MESAEGRRDIQVEERGRKGMYEKQTKRKRDGKFTEERMYEMDGQRAIFERKGG